jgi:hypothetical protein
MHLNRLFTGNMRNQEMKKKLTVPTAQGAAIKVIADSFASFDYTQMSIRIGAVQNNWIMTFD